MGCRAGSLDPADPVLAVLGDDQFDGRATGGDIRTQILIGREVEVGVDLVADASLVLAAARPGDARAQRSSSARLKETPQ